MQGKLEIDNTKSIYAKYILDQLDFIIETPLIVEQIIKFTQIITLILDYERMLNQIEIATRLAPKFNITKESLAIQIQEITSYLDGKDIFHPNSRKFFKNPPTYNF